MEKLKECPFCGGQVKLKKYYESPDGRADKFATIKCGCGNEMCMTGSDISKAQEKFGYTGGYYSMNKALWDGMHQILIDRWNTRISGDYNKALEDVWKFLKAFCGMDVGERQKVFGEYVVGKLVENMSPQEAFAILEAYEKEQAEIKVGDVVFGDDEPDVYGIVTFVSCEMIYIVWSDGSSGVEYDFRDIKKTGRHIDINSVLEQLRGDNDEDN